MNIFECSQSSTEEGVQPQNCNTFLSQQIIHNNPQFSSSYSLSQKNEAFNISQNKPYSQNYLPQVDNTLKLEDLNGKSSAKNTFSNNAQHQQLLQQQQSQQTLKSFNSSNIFYHQSTITTTANGGAMPANSDAAHIISGQSYNPINSNHLSSQSQYNACTESNKDSQQSFNIMHNIEKQQYGDSIRSNKQNQHSQNLIGQVFDQEKRSGSDEEIEDQVRFFSLQQDEEAVSKNSNLIQIKDDQNVTYSKKQQANQQNIQSDNIIQKSEYEKDINCIISQSQNLILNQQHSNNSNQQNRKGSYCGSVMSGTLGFINSDEKIQMKIVNEILNFDDQKLNCTLTSNYNATGQQQFLNTNHVDVGSRIGNSTMKNLFHSTKDFQDISNLMANIEYTEQNIKLLDELSLLNKSIKEIEEKIELYSSQQKYFISSQNLSNQNYIYNTLTVKDRLKSIEEFRTKNLEPDHLKEMLNGRQQNLKTLNKELIKLESEREKQKQMEGDIIKQVDKDFLKDVELMNQGLREISNLKSEVLRDMQTEEELSHNERKSLGKEELIAKLMQRAEMVAQMEDFEEIQEDFKQKFPLEAKYMLQQFQMKRDLDNIQNSQQDLIYHKKDQALLSEQLQAQIQELNDYITLKCNSIQDIQNNKQQQLRLFSDKMEAIEEQITKKCQSFGLESAQSVFLQLFDERYINLSKEALEKQIELVESEEAHLNDQYIEQMESSEQRAQLYQFCSSGSQSISSQRSPQSSPSHCSISHLSQSNRQPNIVTSSPLNLSQSASKQTISVHHYLQDENTQQFNCASEQQKIKETFLIRSTMLRKWREKAREHLALLDLQIRAINEQEQTQNKSQLINRTTMENLIKCYFDSTNISYEQTEIDFLTDLYEQYFEMFLQQKALVVESNAEEKEHSNQLEEVEKKINELKEAKDQVKCEQQRIDEELQKINNTLKTKEQEINSKKIIMENILLQQADKAFQDYIEQQSDVFEGLQKTYGNKALQQIKLGHHKQFREIMKQNQEKRMQKFEEVQTCIEKISKQIQDNIKYVDQQLSEDLSNIQIEIQESNQKRAQLEIDYQTILQKEKEFVRQLESLIQAKKVKVSELLEVGSRYMSYQTYEKRKTQLQKDIEDCESEIRIIQQNLKSSLSQNIYQDCGTKNHQVFENYNSKQESLQITENNGIAFEDNTLLNEMKKDLDELQMQRLALESRLIEINFNISTSNNYDIEKQKQLLPNYTSNIEIIANNIQFKENSKKPHDIPLPVHSQGQIEKGNKRFLKDRQIQKKDFPNSSFFSENEDYINKAVAEYNIPECLNIKLNSGLNASHPDMLNQLFSYSNKESITKFEKNLGDSSQNTGEQQAKQVSINNSFADGLSQEQFMNKSSNVNPSSYYNKQYFSNQHIQNSLNPVPKIQNNNQNNDKNAQIQALSSCSLVTMTEHEDDPIITNNSNCVNNMQKPRNILNHQHQIAIVNQNNINIQQNDNLEGMQFQKLQNQFQQPKTLREIISEDPINNQELDDYQNNEVRNQFEDQITSSPHALEDTTGRQSNQNNKRIVILNNPQQQLQQQQQYEELGHTLQTITEEQVSTNRGYSARNHMQQYLNTNQIPQILNDQLRFQPNHIQYQSQIEQNIYQNNIQNGSIKFQDDQFLNLFDTKSPKRSEFVKQHINADYRIQKNKSQVVEESMSQRERLYARKQKLVQQSQMLNQKQPQLLDNQQSDQYPQQSQHNRCKSLIQNPQESSQLLYQNFKVKDDSGKNSTNKNGFINHLSNQQQFYNTKKSNSGIGYLPTNSIQYQEGYQFQQNKEEQFQNNPINQQENICPNIVQPQLPQVPFQSKIRQNQKNIQPLLNNTYHSSNIQQSQFLNNEINNQFFTPSSNIQVSFNSYLNSSLNKSKQMSKKSKTKCVDTIKCPNNFLPDVKHIQPPLSSKELNSTKYFTNQMQPANNQFFDCSYSQSQNFDQSQRYPVQQLQEQQNTVFMNNYHASNQLNLQQQQYDSQFMDCELDNSKAGLTVNHKKNRRSKSEEMKNVCIPTQVSSKINNMGGIKIPLINSNQSKIRSKSQNVSSQGEQINKNIQSHLLIQQQQIQNYPKHFIYKLHLEQLQNKEAQFLIQIKELLEGGIILKKFSQYQSLKQHVFNPFTSDQMPPENCGFGVRLMNLHKNLTKIEIRHPLKQGTVESTINIDQILRHAIPNTTAELIKMQKQNEPRQQKDQQKQGINKNISQNQEMVDSIQYYAFCIVLDKGGRIEFIAQDYKTFQMWINGISQLVKIKKLLPRLKNYIEQIQII